MRRQRGVTGLHWTAEPGQPGEDGPVSLNVEETQESGMEKRKHPRIQVEGMHIDVSDGIGSCSGNVCDVSRVGLCLLDVAKRFGKNMDAYTAVASSGGKYFKFRVLPRWETASRLSKKIGVEIDEAPWQWTEYVMSLEEARRRG